MFNLNDNLKNKKFLIYGYGKTGNASYNYLKKNNKISIFGDNKKTYWYVSILLIIMAFLLAYLNDSIFQFFE